MLNLIAQFAYLQFLDLLTSLAFLANGVREANPVILLIAEGAGSLLVGLVSAKLAALALGWFCWHSGRVRLLGRVNLFYAGLVVWNLVAFLLSSAATA